MAAALLAGKGAFAAAVKPKSNLTPSQKFMLELERNRHRLPDGMTYFENGGYTLFPLYGASGGLSTDAIFYLYKPAYGSSTGAVPFIGTRVSAAILGGLSDKQIEQSAVYLLSEAIRDFPKQARLVAIAGDDLGNPNQRPYYPIIADGGDMPRPSV